MARPVALALVPYVIFSLFHVLTYLRTTILPAVDPKSTSEADNGTAAMVSKRIGIWVKANYERAMQLAARVEVVLLGLRVVLGLVIRSTTLTTLLVYVGFLRYRFATSPFVRQQFSQVNLVVDHTLADPRVPPAARDAWRTFTNLVSTYFGGRAGKNPAGPAASSSSR
ncbi:Transmembrane nucleoporin [Savitreella phatthalungensis]